LRDDEHTSRAISGLHGTGLAVGAMLTAALAPRLIARFGRARMMWAALAILCLGVVVFASCAVVAVTISGAVLAGFGGTFLLNISVAVLTAHHPGQAGNAAVTQANGLGSAAGIFAPLVISGAIAIGVGWRAGVLVVVLLAVIVASTFGRTAKPDAIAVKPPEPPRATGRLSFEYWRACFVLVMTTAVEFSMTIWSSDVLHNHDGLSKGTAATGVTAIVTGMTIGRLASGRLTLRYRADTLLLCVFGITMVGFGVFWVSTIPLLAYLGLFISGLGISLQFPLGITRAVDFSGGRPDVATAYVALGNGFAIAVAPFGLGAFADHVGSHTAMVVVPGFVVLAALGVVTARRPPKAVRASVGPVAVGDVHGTIG
jgi:MFS family permease